MNDEFRRINLTDIIVKREERQRRDLELDKGGFLSSIQRRGVLNPIIVSQMADGKFELIAGERRFAASQHLELVDIPARLLTELNPIELQIIELEENLHRRDLQWQDLVNGVARIHKLYLALNPIQMIKETADAIGLSDGTVSVYVMVAEGLSEEAEALISEPEAKGPIARAGTAREAYNFLLRRQRREHGDMLEEILSIGEEVKPIPVDELLEPVVPAVTMQRIDSYMIGERLATQPVMVPIPKLSVPAVFSGPVLCSDFLHWAPRYSGPKFNFLHCDFPYGIDAFGSSGQRSGEGRSQMGRDDREDGPYDDSQDTYRKLVLCLVENFDKLISVSAHMMFWFSNKFEIEEWTREQFQRVPGLKFTRFPLIWYKSDNAGVAAIPTQEPRHVYECALMASRGGRNLIKLASDVYAAPTQRKDGESIKPSGMLKHFFSMFVDEHSRVLDPTCGSGSAIVTAENLGAKSVLGLEAGPERAEAATKLILEERNKRRVALMLSGS